VDSGPRVDLDNRIIQVGLYEGLFWLWLVFYRVGQNTFGVQSPNYKLQTTNTFRENPKILLQNTSSTG
jgi:hypothetical protein